MDNLDIIEDIISRERQRVENDMKNGVDPSKTLFESMDRVSKEFQKLREMKSSEVKKLWG